jgi:hypothetical protein
MTKFLNIIQKSKNFINCIYLIESNLFIFFVESNQVLVLILYIHISGYVKYEYTINQ